MNDLNDVPPPERPQHIINQVLTRLDAMSARVTDLELEVRDLKFASRIYGLVAIVVVAFLIERIWHWF